MMELKQLYGYYQEQDLVLFNNREILINGKSFHYNEWHQKGIFSIRDVLNDERKFLSYQEFLQKYNLKCNILRYFQVLAAIPKHLREKARHTSFDKLKFGKDNFLFPLSPTVSINLLKVKSKDFLLAYYKKVCNQGYWPKEMGTRIKRLNLNWPCYFSKLKLICNESKLREFYYKFLHRIIVTKKELYCFRIESNKDCLYCNESDSIGHTFIDCHQSKYFFKYVLEWFNSEHATSYSLSTEEFLFGKFDNAQLARSDGKLKRLNYCLLFAKYSLYCQKLNKKQINFEEFRQ